MFFMIFIKIKDKRNKDNCFRFIKEIVREDPILFDTLTLNEIDLQKTDVAIFHFDILEYVLKCGIDVFDINKKDIKENFKEVLNNIIDIYKTNKLIPHFIMFPELKLNNSNYIEKLITDTNIFYRMGIKREISTIIIPNCIVSIGYEYISLELIKKYFTAKNGSFNTDILPQLK